MQIHIDYNPTPKGHYFISAHLNKKEAISFDNTLKGYRIVKQVYIKKKPFPENVKLDREWETIILDHGKFIKTYHVKWIDQDKIDWLNGELWETVWEKPMNKTLNDELLFYSRLISDHYEDLTNHQKKVKEFEKILSEEIKKLVL